FEPERRAIETDERGDGGDPGRRVHARQLRGGTVLIDAVDPQPVEGHRNGQPRLRRQPEAEPALVHRKAHHDRGRDHARGHGDRKQEGWRESGRHVSVSYGAWALRRPRRRGSGPTFAESLGKTGGVGRPPEQGGVPDTRVRKGPSGTGESQEPIVVDHTEAGNNRETRRER